MKFNPVYEMFHASVNTTDNYPISIAAYFYGCAASSTGFRILSGDPSQLNTVLISRNH